MVVKRFLLTLVLMVSYCSLLSEHNAVGAHFPDAHGHDDMGHINFGSDTDIQKQMIQAEKLVEDAAKYFSEHSLGKSCRSFEEDSQWQQGSFFIFVFGEDGACYLHGRELSVLWENFTDVDKTRELRGSTFLGEEFIQEMLEKGRKGGWVTYDWNYSSKYSYVRTVKKGGKNFIIGTGFYPQSPRFRTQQMVKRAVRLGENRGAEELFRMINNPTGEFIKGDIYLWAYDMDGNAFAHGHNLAMVGQNRMNWKDSDGKLRNQVMVDLIKDHGEGWIDYKERDILKLAFVESFKDKRTGKQYIVGGGYYPTIDDDTIISYVKRAIDYLKAEGATIALRDFTSRAGGFMQGPLRLFVLNLNGVVLADAQNPIFIGQNVIDSRDPEGKKMIQEIIDVAKKSKRGWVTFVDKQAYKMTYVELVEIPDGKYVIGAGYWPSSKEHTAQSLTEKAVNYLENNSLVDSLHAFTGSSSEFLRGDLFVMVYNEEGICLSYGLDRDRIWFDASQERDEKGNPIIQRILDKAKRGGGWIEYPWSNGIKRSYVKLVTKENVIVQSGEKTIRDKKEELVVGKLSTRKKAHKSETKQSYIVGVGFFK